MANKTLKDISEDMADIDICMMITHGENDALSARPMSNNGDVEYKGDSYFFTDAKAHMVKEIKTNPAISLVFNGKHQLYISVQGKAKLSTDKKEMEGHWTKDLDKWFKDGIDTPGLTLIAVHADSIKYWQKGEEGEVKL